MSLAYKFVNSPVGLLKLVASDKGLLAILWNNDNPQRVRLEDLVEDSLHPLLAQTDNELKDYFAGRPCHRVIGASGNLPGFAGGLEAKEHLLKLEASSVERSSICY